MLKPVELELNNGIHSENVYEFLLCAKCDDLQGSWKKLTVNPC